MNTQQEIKRAIRLIESMIKPNSADYDYWYNIKLELQLRVRDE